MMCCDEVRIIETAMTALLCSIIEEISVHYFEDRQAEDQKEVQIQEEVQIQATDTQAIQEEEPDIATACGSADCISERKEERKRRQLFLPQTKEPKPSSSKVKEIQRKKKISTLLPTPKARQGPRKESIINFGTIEICRLNKPVMDMIGKLRPLLADVNIFLDTNGFCKCDLNLLRPSLTELIRTLAPIDGLFGLSIIKLLHIDVEPLRTVFKHVRLLHFRDSYIFGKDMKLLTDWLNSSQGATGNQKEPRMLKCDFQLDDFEQAVLEMKEAFLSATHHVHYFVQLQHYPNLKENSFENKRTNEVLCMELTKFSTVISRYPIGTSVEWLAQKKTELLEWDHLQKERQFTVHLQPIANDRNGTKDKK